MDSAAALYQPGCLTAPGFQAPPPSSTRTLHYAELFYGDGDWLRVESAPSYEETLDREQEPLSQAAAAILAAADRGPLDIIALGTGGGRREVSLVQQLLDQGGQDLHLYFIDLTEAQISAAHDHALQVLSPYSSRGVAVIPFIGDMHQLPAYQGVLRRPSRGPWRRRLVVALGSTLGNLDELGYLREVLGPFLRAGDLLLFDCAQCPAAGTADPRLSAPVPLALVRWFSAALARRGQELHHVEVRLGSAPAVPGSYAIEFIGHTPDGEYRLARVGRYEPQKLSAAICALGWAERSILPFAEGSYPQALYLFERTAKGPGVSS